MTAFNAQQNNISNATILKIRPKAVPRKSSSRMAMLITPLTSCISEKLGKIT